ncbi:hypothetical protein TRVA0_033S00738 [Trichomonascus vanleenenianus]|uniref:uncharacterized protein n=1 Tax=Trichomonascus vanleenenianus TaxID=2268995 RepID=UPI003EC9EE31
MDQVAELYELSEEPVDWVVVCNTVSERQRRLVDAIGQERVTVAATTAGSEQNGLPDSIETVQVGSMRASKEDISAVLEPALAGSDSRTKVVVFFGETVVEELDSGVVFVFNAIRAVLGAVGTTRQVRFLFVCDVKGVMGVPGEALQSANLAAVEGLFETLAVEIGPFGHGATVVHVGDEEVTPSSKVNDWAKIVAGLGHCEAAPGKVTVGERQKGAVRAKLRWIVEEIEDWKYLFE